MADSRPGPLHAVGAAIGALGRSASGPALRALTAPPVARAGHRFATRAARLWGRLLGGEEQQVGELTVISGLPTWAFGRGGTTIGATFLTRSALSPEILEHEDVHRRQWERYGLWFIPMYLAAGQDGLRNRFEIEADLVKGGYLPKPARRPGGRAAERAGGRPGEPPA
ncbi:hypothetical protein FQ330_09935 [Agrococcus sediminis]|uniref:Fe-S oxidoreductase n=1 Tax=Agrococcus sediminis TaxID=2599924 RepID=A0A5M8Q8A8_9MICO|nr:hypothetical protein [Agrococcus sediminis]KAA6432089.1 hypothetical protein FQ330_09935 [Agrococcus sediminis]